VYYLEKENSQLRLLGKVSWVFCEWRKYHFGLKEITYNLRLGSSYIPDPEPPFVPGINTGGNGCIFCSEVPFQYQIVKYAAEILILT